MWRSRRVWLLLLIALIAGGALIPRVQEQRHRSQAIDVLRRNGVGGPNLIPLIKAHWLPAWAKYRLARADVTHVHLSSRCNLDECITALQPFPNIQYVMIEKQAITPASLDQLAAVPYVKTLWINRSTLPADFAARLSRLNVSELFTRDAVWSSGTFSLEGLPKTLTVLSLKNASFSNGDLKPLAQLPRLRMLGLSQTVVGDADLETLAECPRLEYLTLMETNVTDEGLLKLADSSSLKQVNCRGTRVTADGVEAAQRRRPEMKVIFGEIVVESPRLQPAFNRR